MVFPQLSGTDRAGVRGEGTRLHSRLSDYGCGRVLPRANDFVNSQHTITARNVDFTCAVSSLSVRGVPHLLGMSAPFPFPRTLTLRFLSKLSRILYVRRLSPIVRHRLACVYKGRNLGMGVCNGLSNGILRTKRGYTSSMT